MTLLLQVLFPYLVFFYVIDSFVLIKKFHIAFSSHFGRKFQIKRRGIRFIGLSPFCKFFQAINFPFFATKDGIYIWNKDNLGDCDLYERKHFDLILFDEIGKIECDGATLKVNDSKKIHLHSAPLANFLADKIEKLKKCMPDQQIHAHKGHFDNPDIIKKTKNVYSNRFLLIQFLGAVLFLYTFIFLPGFLYVNLPMRFDFLITVIILFYFLTAGLSWQIHNKICKERSKNILFLLTLIFSPVSSIHAMHIITKDISSDFNWLALSAQLLPKEKFKSILVKELKRIHFSKIKCDDSDVMAFLFIKDKEYRPFLDQLGLKQDDIFAPPTSGDTTAYCYCPLCETDFQQGMAICPDCDIALLGY